MAPLIFFFFFIILQEAADQNLCLLLFKPIKQVPQVARMFPIWCLIRFKEISYEPFP